MWDTNQILSRTRFSPADTEEDSSVGPSESIGDEDFTFWFGDLNYRLDDIPGEDVRRLLLLHTRNEYDVFNKSKRRIDSELGFMDPPTKDLAVTTHYEIQDLENPASRSGAEPALDPKNDPASLQTTLASLLRHDQLRAQQRLGKAFHEGWREGEINFLPTYKYDVGSVGMFDSGEKKRSPSWCDRILYRTKTDKMLYERRISREDEARKKDEDMKARGLEEAANDQNVLFDYDPDTDGGTYTDDYDEAEDNACGSEFLKTGEDFPDTIELEHYISHQRVLSSDHKPLDAIFTLTYDTIVPELKAKIHQEVARDFDKAENEGRPSVTMVVDPPSDSSASADGSTAITELSVVDFEEVRYQDSRSDIGEHRPYTSHF